MNPAHPFLLAAALVFLVLGDSRGAVVRADAQVVNPSGWNEIDPFLAPLAMFPTPYDGPYLLYDRQFVLTQTAVPGDGLFLLEVAPISPTEFLFSSAGIAEAFSLYRVSPGDIFGVDYTNSQPSFVNNWADPGMGLLDLPLGGSVFIGYWDDRSFDGLLSATPDDLFGWAEIHNIGGELIVADSATALGGGIVIGTAVQIPEPSVLCLFPLLAAMALLGRRRLSDAR